MGWGVATNQSTLFSCLFTAWLSVHSKVKLDPPTPNKTTTNKQNRTNSNNNNINKRRRRRKYVAYIGKLC